jgi:hypothetical protein
VELAQVDPANGDRCLTADPNPNKWGDPGRLADCTTFTVLFGGNGQLAIKRVAVAQRWDVNETNRNRDSVFVGPDYPVNNSANLRDRKLVPGVVRDDRVPGKGANNLASPADLAFPSPLVDPAVQEICSEYSVNSMYILDQTARKEAGAAPWSSYLKQRASDARVLVNPYTGQLAKPSY